MSTLLIFSLMLAVVVSCTFFFFIGKRNMGDQATLAISEICKQGKTLEDQIVQLAINVKDLCDEVNLLKQENLVLQEQIVALAEDVKHISSKCVLME